MLRIILALFIAAHSIGHILFFVSILGLADWGQSTRSWLFTEQTTARLIGSLLWITVMILFGCSVYGLLAQQPWWRNAATVAAALSIVGLLIFWMNPVSSPAVSALVFNLMVLGALFIAHWPSVEAVGA
jgi:hypothetical protein